MLHMPWYKKSHSSHFNDANVPIKRYKCILFVCNGVFVLVYYLALFILFLLSLITNHIIKEIL